MLENIYDFLHSITLPFLSRSNAVAVVRKGTLPFLNTTLPLLLEKEGKLVILFWEHPLETILRSNYIQC